MSPSPRSYEYVTPIPRSSQSQRDRWVQCHPHPPLLMSKSTWPLGSMSPSPENNTFYSLHMYSEIIWTNITKNYEASTCRCVSPTASETIGCSSIFCWTLFGILPPASRWENTTTIVSKSIQSATRKTGLCPDCLSRASMRVLHAAKNFGLRYCTLVSSAFPRLIGVYQHTSQIYLSSLHQHWFVLAWTLIPTRCSNIF